MYSISEKGSSQSDEEENNNDNNELSENSNPPLNQQISIEDAEDDSLRSGSAASGSINSSLDPESQATTNNQNCGTMRSNAQKIQEVECLEEIIEPPALD